jgi:Rad3-related DNA helicase
MFRSNEQEELYARIIKHIQAPKNPLLLEGGTGLGKTRAYLAAIESSDKRIAIILPSHALINQLLDSKDLAAVGIYDIRAFRPRSFFESAKEWSMHKQDAMEARVMICTSASVIIDEQLGGDYNGSSQRDILIFDEADQLPSMAALQQDLTITKDRLEALKINTSDFKLAANEVLNNPQAEREECAIASKIRWSADNPRWYRSPGFTPEGDLVLFHKLPGRMLKKLSNDSRSIFVSATLSSGIGGFDNFKKAMGIEHQSMFSSQVEPEKHGKLDFKTHDINARTEEELMLQKTIEEIAAAEKPCLVVTPSHKMTAEINEAIGEVEGVIVKAGAWAGMDSKEAIKTIIIPKVPFGRPVEVENQQMTQYIDSKIEAQRRMKQVIGRGIRTPDSKCKVVVIDNRVEGLDGWLPTRFVRAWKNRELA